MDSLSSWLHALGLEQYLPLFERNGIDLRSLPLLGDSELAELGVLLGHRKLLFKAMAELDAAQTPARSFDAELTPQHAGRIQAERRQLTVLFCDLVGSTALAQRLDPEALRELLHAYQQACSRVIEKYAGHVAQYLGDGLVVYFGWPRAHEDDAERAVRAALEIIEAVRQMPAAESLQVRMGIATGPVVVGETGAGDASVPKAAVGPTPNLAARLQALAGPNQVVIAPTTHRLLGDTFKYEDLGEHALKGIAETVRATRITDVAHAESRFEATHSGRFTPFVGREHELALLLGRWEQACEGEGQVVLLCGEPGIGKSRIALVLRERLAPVPHTRLRWQCSPYLTSSAFHPITNQLERAAGFEQEDTPSTKLDKLEATLGLSAEELPGVAPLIAALLSLPIERYPARVFSPQKQKELTMAALADQVVRLAQRSPVLMIVEDAHWIDPSTLEALALMVERIRNAAILLVITCRPELVPPWTGHGNVTLLNLNRLSRRHGAAMMSELTGGKSLPGEVLEQILAQTDGVPLFVEELTKTVLEAGFLRDAGDRYEWSGPLPSLAIPTTLQDSLMARLDRLAPAKEVAQIGACIGREFSYGLLAAVAPLQGEQLDQALRQLVEAEVVFRRGSPPEATYTFKHALVQDAAHDSLLKSKRQQVHAQIARAIEEQDPNRLDTQPELLAHHYTAAGLLAVAIPLWRQAGELALKRVALQEAIAHLNRGLELCTKLPVSGERDALELSLHTPLVAAWIALKSWATPEIGEHAESIVRLARALGKPEPLLAGLYGLWVNTMTQGRIAESLDWAHRLRTEAQTTDSADLAICAETAATNSLYYLGELVRAREHRERLLALYDEERFQRLGQILGGDSRTAVGVHASLFTWMLGYADQAVKISDETITHARRFGHPFNLSWALTVGAFVFDYRSEPQRVFERAAELERLGREHAMWYVLEVFCPLSKGLALLRAGQPDEAIGLLRAVLVWKLQNSSHIHIPYVKSALAEGLALQGDQEAALWLIDEALEQIARPGWQERAHLAEILRLKGWLLLRQGRIEGAGHALREAIVVAREQHAKSWELRASSTLARLLAEQGDRVAAHQLLAPIYGWFTEGLDTVDLKEARALLDELEVAK